MRSGKNKMMDYTYHDIRNSNKFSMLLKLEQDKIVDFVFKYFKKNNNATRMFYFLNILFVILLIRIMVEGFLMNDVSWGKVLLYSFFGLLAGMAAVIPFHEGIHGLAYKMVGAKKIKFGMDIKQGIFFVTADRFVIGRNKFFVVALAPFVVLTAVFLTGFYLSPFYYKWMFIVTLISHSTMCIGDFAFMSFFFEYPEKELYTFDEPEKKLSYVYEKENGQH